MISAVVILKRHGRFIAALKMQLENWLAAGWEQIGSEATLLVFSS